MSTNVLPAVVRPALSQPAAPSSTEEIERAEERKMLDRCAQGDERAIRWVLSKYRERVTRLAAHVLRSPKEAEDVAQDAFLKAFRQMDQFQGKSSFYAWLYRIVVNLCLDRLRKKSVSSEMPMDDAMLPFLCASSPDLDLRMAVHQTLDSLTPPMRAALVLRELEGMEYAEIAETLGVPLGTVRSRLNSAREQFRLRWSQQMEELRNV